ncbi:predicted protein [Chaetoceros tenuissimus]|uniref:Uncharacterized protein n=1 Tax=Chaetoceros tenuissimus TaxID=426638 RepID=A0AAD3D6Q2_9STRA|nr:predicted protein [Chaetoceros tenuissimus]
MSEVVLFKDEKSLAEAGENIESWNEADLLYFKDPRMWVFTIFDMLHEHEHILDKVFEGPTLKQWLKQTQRRTEAMVTSSITSETIQGVLTGGNVIDTAVAVMMIIVGWTADETTEARSYCKLMKRLANVTKNTKKISIKARFALSKTMISSYIYLYHSIYELVALDTVYRSAILEQLLRNINYTMVTL